VATCLFCGIVGSEVRAHLVLDEPATVAFLDHRPVFKGHTLVVPRHHVETLADLPAEALAPLFAAVQRVERAVVGATGAQGSWVSLNNTVSQAVPHLHVHVVPRWKDDRLFSPKLIWKRRPYRSFPSMCAATFSSKCRLKNSLA